MLSNGNGFRRCEFAKCGGRCSVLAVAVYESKHLCARHYRLVSTGTMRVKPRNRLRLTSTIQSTPESVHEPAGRPSLASQVRDAYRMLDAKPIRGDYFAPTGRGCCPASALAACKGLAEWGDSNAVDHYMLREHSEAWYSGFLDAVDGDTCNPLVNEIAMERRGDYRSGYQVGKRVTWEVARL